LPPLPEGPKPPDGFDKKKYLWGKVPGARLAKSIFAVVPPDEAEIRRTIAIQELHEGKPVSRGNSYERGNSGEGKTVALDLTTGDRKSVLGKERPSMMPKKEKEKHKARLIKLDVKILNHFFLQKKEEKKDDKQAGGADKNQRKKTVHAVLEAKKTQAVEIFLSGTGVTLDKVQAAVVDLDHTALTGEVLKKVIDFYPESEDRQLLKDAKPEAEALKLPMAKGEAFLFGLLAIDNFVERATCCVARAQFFQEIETVEKDVDLVDKAMHGVDASEALQTIVFLVLAIGNYLNSGTNWGSQRAFNLESLISLCDVESYAEKNFSLMNLLCLHLEQACPSTYDVLVDLQECAEAARVDIEESKKKSQEIGKSLTYVEEVAARSTDKFGDEMRAFVESAKESSERLLEKVSAAEELQKRINEKFGEKPQQAVGEVLTKLGKFRKEMDEARRSNIIRKAKKAKEAAKRKEEEEKEKKKRSVKEAAAAIDDWERRQAEEKAAAKLKQAMHLVAEAVSGAKEPTDESESAEPAKQDEVIQPSSSDDEGPQVITDALAPLQKGPSRGRKGKDSGVLVPSESNTDLHQPRGRTLGAPRLLTMSEQRAERRERRSDPTKNKPIETKPENERNSDPLERLPRQRTGNFERITPKEPKTLGFTTGQGLSQSATEELKSRGFFDEAEDKPDQEKMEGTVVYKPPVKKDP
jgi:hypothetical protein